MDLRQTRLTADEWDALEVPIGQAELDILRVIKNGYNDVSYCKNKALSMVTFMKIHKDLSHYHLFFYNRYFATTIAEFKTKYKCPSCSIPKEKKKNVYKLKKSDIIRIKNADRKLNAVKGNIFEYILLGQLKILYRAKLNTKAFYSTYYTLSVLLKRHIEGLNPYVMGHAQATIDAYLPSINTQGFVRTAPSFMDGNVTLARYEDTKLYTHQKELFALAKLSGGKLILYQAPTGMGKTVSPVGLSDGKKIIFVCAAKHIGLQLARACISLELKIAVAFGCDDPGGIRLHYFAAKDYERNRRTGGIFRVDNAVGDDVQIIISDIQSYLPSMHYMLAFNRKEDIVWYWDEPTITLDYQHHKYHSVLAKNWKNNLIPNIVLSSATLPSQEELAPFIKSYMVRFDSVAIHTIQGEDRSKSIPVLDPSGYLVLPHLIFPEHSSVRACVTYVTATRAVMRHLPLCGICPAIDCITDLFPIKRRYQLNNYYESVLSITSKSLKTYYLFLLNSLSSIWPKIYEYFQTKREKYLSSTVYLTTKDAQTLRGGPTLFLARDIGKIARYCVRSAAISETVLQQVLASISHNTNIRKKIIALEADLTRMGEHKAGPRQDRDGKGGRDRGEKTELEDRQRALECLHMSIRKVQLPPQFIPNSPEHLRLWHPLLDSTQSSVLGAPFTASIGPDIAKQIMMSTVEPKWKILLLMGIGVFTSHNCPRYTSIMRELAHKEQLYLIIADTDYIYGTNYQFCHGYLGKDLGAISQEKVLQALGRIGRSKGDLNYSVRLRNQKLIPKLFLKEEDKTEVRNMNRLFT